MTKLVFGGSFNPIHVGHLICARAAAEAMGFQKVVLMPSAQPPHKADVAAKEDRLLLCRCAASISNMFEVSDLEIHRTGPSYTIDTVRALKTQGWTHVNWLVGADMFVTLPSWHESAALLQETRFVIMRRPGFDIDWQSLPPEYRALEANVVTTPLIQISATDIRRRIAAGLDISFLVPHCVARAVESRGMYRQATR